MLGAPDLSIILTVLGFLVQVNAQKHVHDAGFEV